MKIYMKLSKKLLEIMRVNLKWWGIYQLVINFERLIQIQKYYCYEAYINSIDEGYDAQDAIFNG